MNQWNLVSYPIDAEYKRKGLYIMPLQCQKTMIAKAVFSKKGVERVSFLPAYIDSDARPFALPSTDPRFPEMLENMEWVSDQHSHKFTVDGDEIVVTAE